MTINISSVGFAVAMLAIYALCAFAAGLGNQFATRFVNWLFDKSRNRHNGPTKPPLNPPSECGRNVPRGNNTHRNSKTRSIIPDSDNRTTRNGNNAIKANRLGTIVPGNGTAYTKDHNRPQRHGPRNHR